jgi:hypothetical protein
VPGSVYTQNFDSLPNPGATSVNSDNPVTIDGITYSLSNPYDFAFPVSPSGTNGGLGISSLAGWYGLADPHASVGTRFGATDGDQTTGGQISFGLPNSSNRALGLLATSTTGYTAFGARFINETANSLRYITLQFTGEVWRQSNLPKTLEFYYFIDPTATATFSISVTAFLPGLNVNLPIVPGDVGGAAVDGAISINQTNLGVVNLVITNWAPGAALWLVWEMADSTGKAQGLAIDSLSFSAYNTVNSAPVLPLQTNVTINELTLLTVTNTATDSDLPANTLVYTLAVTNVLNNSAVTNAAVSTNGIITWTPTEAQGPSTNVFTTVVTDNGVPPLSATNTFNVVVNEVNSAPVLPLQTNVTINELTLLTVTNTATDLDIPANVLTYSLVNSPTNAVISTNGIITWTPSQAQSPGTNPITTVVTDNGVPPLSATNSFNVIVREANVAPSLGVISTQIVNELTLLTVTNAATEPNIHSITMGYALVNPPTNAVISTNGVFTWTPAQNQSPGTNTITTVVTNSNPYDTINPQLPATNSFTVIVMEVNMAPVFGLVPTQIVNELTLLTVTNAAIEPNIHSITTGYGLIDPPAGAGIDSNGIFTWTPAQNQSPGTNTITTVVTNSNPYDVVNPRLTATNSFTVTVFPPPQLQDIKMSGNGFIFTLPTLAGQTYQTEYKNDLNDTNWTPLGAPITGTGTSLTLTNNLSDFPQRFFRIRILP